MPVLGICYGMQTMAQQLGGKVESSANANSVTPRSWGAAIHGFSPASRIKTNAEGHGLLDVWMSHGDKVTELPPGFKVIGSSESCPPWRPWPTRAGGFYAVQFHPEVTHPQGQAMLARFVHEICGCGSTTGTCPTTSTRPSRRCAPRSVQDEVILGLSGGVDSSVVAALLHRAIGDQLTCVFVDNGLLRLNEAEQVMQTFARNLGVKVIHVDATEQFMGHLQGVSDPEAKRKIIGREFVEVFQAGSRQEIAQRPLAGPGHHLSGRDRIGRRQDRQGPRHQEPPQRRRPAETQSNLKLLEPLRELFKDEVRELGVALGLPTRWSIAIPSPVPAWGAHPGRGPEANSPICCAGPTPSSSTNCGPPTGTTRPARLSPFPPGEERRRHGRRPHLRIRGGAAGRADPGFHDRPLGRTAPQPARQGVEPHHQRGARHQPGVYDISKPPATIEWE